MKQNLLALFFLLAFGGPMFAQKTIYVKQNAAGANNGSSWQNAYTSLADALLGAASGDQIWVAAGTYTPAASFQMSAGVALYGGFNGTESTLGARNIAANVTKLNGDIAGDDIVGDFTQKRSDNAQHVLEIAAGASATDRAVVDGFTVSGGQTLVGNANPDLSRRGGGILTTAPTTVRNCRFTDNYADSGGGLAAVTTSASGVAVEDCIFEKNGVASLSAGIFLRDVIDGGDIRRCTFRDNKTNRGCLYMITSGDIAIDSCLFENNEAGFNPCAGLYTWQTTFTLTNSIFRGNHAVDYGAMYNDGRNGVYPFTIDKCLFEGNTVTDTTSGASAVSGAMFNSTATGVIKNTIFRNNEAEFGGAVYNNGSIPNKLLVFDSCLFEGNKATISRGGGMYNYAAHYELKNTLFDANLASASSGSAMHNDSLSVYLVHDCTFQGGGATFGGAISNYRGGDVGTYDNCRFLGNAAVTSGGAMTNGFGAKTTIKNSHFEGNSAKFGGAVFAQNSFTSVTIQKTVITGNNVENNGGGFANSGGITLTVEDSRIELNQGETGGGATLVDDTFNLAKATFKNTIFLSNFATTQAAGLNVSNMDVTLENCLFAGNQNFGTGAGGAISNNASAGTSPIKAVNCTFTENTAAIGAGIAQWEDTTANVAATMSLQNCIFFNNGDLSYEIEDGQPEVISLGGNLCGDATLTGILTQTNDQLSVDPLFVDPVNLDYHLQPGSPCIDKGVATGAPATDLEGNPRSGAGPDQGCYEFATVGTHTPGSAVLPMRLMPNPVVEQTILTLESDWAGEARIEVYAQNGALLRSMVANKPAGRWAHVVNVRDLPAGMYRVKAQLGASVYEAGLMKR